MRARSLMAALIGLSVSSAHVWAVAMPTSINREVSYSIAEGSSDSKTNTTTGVFNDSVNGPQGPGTVMAAQNTDIQPLMLGGTGSADAFASSGAPETHADSFFDVFFDLPADHAYGLSGLLQSSVDGGFALATFQLTGPGGLNLMFASVNNSPDAVIGGAGVLAAGSYHLMVTASVDSSLEGPPDTAFSTHANFDFSLTLRELEGATVPEPMSAMLGLIGAGVLGLRTARRRA